MATSSVMTQQVNWKMFSDIISGEIPSRAPRTLHCGNESPGSPRQLFLGMAARRSCSVATWLRWGGVNLLTPALPEVGVLMDTANT